MLRNRAVVWCREHHIPDVEANEIIAGSVVRAFAFSEQEAEAMDRCEAMLFGMLLHSPTSSIVGPGLLAAVPGFMPGYAALARSLTHYAHGGIICGLPP